ncbi:glucose-1-phosphate adenylyltransferase [Pelagirhabdus alkalitolerans]|uniref:Glucose-1-phosphate adenylyltransferase n=1 Tax=Pelagirhabdus alkalitolerans TaxID=1612202 RepID=A0A1G6KAK3_9BACI|nr:glucose-1-phosphate adenylyltransferase subunit GlgD [Pelagirhabdus alkalitolerans]SDC28092.1 glucose-1-phosphate adenylyltransferase [Pelagirhabdus alkalitolerans]
MKRTVGIVINSSNHLDLGQMIRNRSIHTIPIGGKYRLIDFSLSQLVNFSEDLYVGVIGSYNYRSLVDHLNQGQDWSFSRKSHDLTLLQGDKRAKIGSISRIALDDFYDNMPFFKKLPPHVDQVIISGSNIVSNINMDKVMETHRKTNADVTMLYKKDYQGEILNKEILIKRDQDRITNIYNRENESGEDGEVFIDHLVIKRELFDQILEEGNKRRVIDFIDLIEDNVSKLDVRGYEVESYVKIINSLNAYFECSQDMLKCQVQLELFKNKDQQIFTKSKDNHPTVYKKQALVKQSMIASGAVINGTVEKSIVFRNVVIEEGAHVKNSIIMQGTKINAGAYVENVITDKYVTIGQGEYRANHSDAPIFIMND